MIPMTPSDLIPSGSKHLGEIISAVIFSIGTSVGVTLWLLASHSAGLHDNTVEEQRFIDARLNIIKANDQLSQDMHELRKEIYVIGGIKASHEELKLDVRELKKEIAILQRGINDHE